MNFWIPKYEHCSCYWTCADQPGRAYHYPDPDCAKHSLKPLRVTMKDDE